MEPTRTQYFFATGRWIQAVFLPICIGVPLLTVAIVVRGLAPTLEPLSEAWNLLRLLVWIVTSLVLGVLSSLVICLMVRLMLEPIVHIRERINGAPFREGDSVRILSKPHRDRVVRVYASWEGSSVRVDLGQDERDKRKDIFYPWELLRVSDRAEAGQRDT